jgi:hypothetical protein
VDRNLLFQQNPASLAISVIVMHGKSNKFQDLEPMIPGVMDLLNKELAPRVHQVGTGD